MNPEDLSIEELQKLLVQKQDEAKKELEEPQTDDVVVGNDFKVNRKDSGPRREAVKAGKNTWSDTGEHKDVDTPDVDPIPRTRSRAQKIEKNCHVCGKTFSVHPRLISGEYMRCNKCIGR